MKTIFNFRQIYAKLYLWAADMRGVTAIETGLLVSGISTVLAGAGFAFGDEIQGFLGQFSGALEKNVTEYR